MSHTRCLSGFTHRIPTLPFFWTTTPFFRCPPWQRSEHARFYKLLPKVILSDMSIVYSSIIYVSMMLLKCNERPFDILGYQKPSPEFHQKPCSYRSYWFTESFPHYWSWYGCLKSTDGLIYLLYFTNLLYMVACFCHHLSDNYVDLSDLYVVLSDFMLTCQIFMLTCNLFICKKMNLKNMFLPN